LKRSQVLKLFFDILEEKDIAIFTTGTMCREAFFIKDRKANFYLIGSMGLVSSIGLGIAMNTDKKVFIFDGDGSILMDLGTMAVISNESPANLFHIILDNEAYQTTGGQPTISSSVDLSNIAKSIGYRQTILIKNDIFPHDLKELFQNKGPVCIVLKIDDDEMGVSRIQIQPEILSERLREVLSE
jgi:sulfopyruvate decarboxylase subunit beta